MENHKVKILLVDDEVRIREILEKRFFMLDYDVVTAGSGEEALSAFAIYAPELIVLNVMMSNLDGYRICRELRKHSDIPIVIMLRAVEDLVDPITRLEVAVDEYVVKPFSPKELESKIRSQLKRIGRLTSAVDLNSPGIIHINNHLKMDTQRRQIYKDDERLRLTDAEYRLLEFLVNNSGKAFSPKEILQQVWNDTIESAQANRMVSVYIARLRSKLEDNCNNPKFLLNTRGITNGYLFQKPENF